MFRPNGVITTYFIRWYCSPQNHWNGGSLLFSFFLLSQDLNWSPGEPLDSQLMWLRTDILDSKLKDWFKESFSTVLAHGWWIRRIKPFVKEVGETIRLILKKKGFSIQLFTLREYLENQVFLNDPDLSRRNKRWKKWTAVSSYQPVFWPVAPPLW